MSKTKFPKVRVNASEVRCSTPSVENGSENTKRLGIRVGSFNIGYRDGRDLHWVLMPDTISNGITYQPDCSESFESVRDKYHWGHVRIDNKYLIEREAEAEAEAAA